MYEGSGAITNHSCGGPERHSESRIARSNEAARVWRLPPPLLGVPRLSWIASYTEAARPPIAAPKRVVRSPGSLFATPPFVSSTTPSGVPHQRVDINDWFYVGCVAVT